LAIPTSCSAPIQPRSGWDRCRKSAAPRLLPRRGRARAAKPALVDGQPALAVIMGGQLRIVLLLIISGDRISAVEAVADAERIGQFDVEML
jgi:hypothetical protein